jgi:TPP-dependent 2-oxoacid decarboxylase
MKIKMYRYSSQSKTTLGVILIDNKFQCYTIEDRYRKEKVKHETRIPKGNYKIKLRDFGSHYNKYIGKYAGHKGMLWLQDVPEFTDILIHIGNDQEDTSGCILTGSTANNNSKYKGQVTASTEAYLDMYFKVLEAFENGEDVSITIEDLDTPYGA